MNSIASGLLNLYITTRHACLLHCENLVKSALNIIKISSEWSIVTVSGLPAYMYIVCAIGKRKCYTIM